MICTFGREMLRSRFNVKWNEMINNGWQIVTENRWGYDVSLRYQKKKAKPLCGGGGGGDMLRWYIGGLTRVNVILTVFWIVFWRKVGWVGTVSSMRGRPGECDWMKTKSLSLVLFFLLFPNDNLMFFFPPEFFTLSAFTMRWGGYELMRRARSGGLRARRQLRNS
jgi:hypothetical protein